MCFSVRPSSAPRLGFCVLLGLTVVCSLVRISCAPWLDCRLLLGCMPDEKVVFSSVVGFLPFPCLDCRVCWGDSLETHRDPHSHIFVRVKI